MGTNPNLLSAPGPASPATVSPAFRHDFIEAFAQSDRAALRGRAILGGLKGGQLFQARPFAAAKAALLLIAGAFCAFLLSTEASRAQDVSGSCDSPSEIAVLSTPAAPWKGAPLRVIFAMEKPSAGELSLIAPDGSVAAKSSGRRGGPPYFWFAEVASPAAGTWQARLARHGGEANCKTVTREITGT